MTHMAMTPFPSSPPLPLPAPQTLASAPQNPGKLAARAAERVRADNDEDGSMPSAAKMRAMHPSDAAALQGAAGGRRHRAPPAGSVARWGGVGGLNGAGIVVHGGAEVSGLQRMAPLAVVGEGQAFGEELLGLSADAIRVNEDGEECLVSGADALGSTLAGGRNLFVYQPLSADHSQITLSA